MTAIKALLTLIVVLLSTFAAHSAPVAPFAWLCESLGSHELDTELKKEINAFIWNGEVLTHKSVEGHYIYTPFISNNFAEQSAVIGDSIVAYTFKVDDSDYGPTFENWVTLNIYSAGLDWEEFVIELVDATVSKKNFLLSASATTYSGCH